MYYWSFNIKKIYYFSKCPTGPQEILLNGKGGLLFNVGNHNQLANKIIYYQKIKKMFKKLSMQLKNCIDLIIK